MEMFIEKVGNAHT